MQERRVLSSNIRVEILRRLAGGQWVPFTVLWHSSGLNSGVVSNHLERLVAASFIIEEKLFVGRRPQTRYRITPDGSRAIQVSSAIERAGTKKA
jgi:predicted transcriptional regulator